MSNGRSAGLRDQWLVLGSLDAYRNAIAVRPDDQTDINVYGQANRIEVRSVDVSGGAVDLRVQTGGAT